MRWPCSIRPVAAVERVLACGAVEPAVRGSGAVGQRIDAICNQLITSRGHHQPADASTSPPTAALLLASDDDAAAAAAAAGRCYDNVVVKQEVQVRHVTAAV